MRRRNGLPRMLVDGKEIGLRDPDQFVGYVGEANAPTAIRTFTTLLWMRGRYGTGNGGMSLAMIIFFLRFQSLSAY